MGLDNNKITWIIENNAIDNVICRTFELRPGILAEFVCALANSDGGYILIGVDAGNGRIKVNGCSTGFYVSNIISAVKSKLSREIPIEYGFVPINRMNIFVIQVSESEQKVLVDGKYYVYENNSVKEKSAKC